MQQQDFQNLQAIDELADLVAETLAKRWLAQRGTAGDDNIERQDSQHYSEQRVNSN